MASAQAGSDEAWYTRFFNDIGKLMFFYAWPTDKYDHVELGNVSWRTDGADVSILLYGNSWLEGRIWTEMVAEVRHGRLTNFHFGRNNGLISPGSTMGVLGDAIQALNEDYKRQQAKETRAPEFAAPAQLARKKLCTSTSRYRL